MSRLPLFLGMIAVACATGAGTARAENICVANGQTFRQGETACLRLPCAEPYTARCTMVLNNSSWQKIADGCPEASRRPVRVAALAASPR